MRLRTVCLAAFALAVLAGLPAAAAAALDSEIVYIGSIEASDCTAAVGW